MPPLAETQARFFNALLFPLRGSSRRSTDLPESPEPHHPEFLATADSLIRPSPTLMPAECLELYHRQYWFRLLDSIAEDFPGLKRLLGDPVFWDLIENHLLAHPSESFTLRHLGRHMSAFVRTYIDDPILRQRAASVAAIEWAMMESFEARDVPAANPEHIAEREFTLQAHVRLLETSSNAAIWLDDPETAWHDHGPFHAATWRGPEGGVRHRALEPGEFHLLSLLPGRAWRLHAWLEQSTSSIPDAACLRRWFATWQTDHWFARL